MTNPETLQIAIDESRLGAGLRPGVVWLMYVLDIMPWSADAVWNLVEVRSDFYSSRILRSLADYKGSLGEAASE